MTDNIKIAAEERIKQQGNWTSVKIFKALIYPTVLKGYISIADQVVVSGSNFFLNIFFARFLTIEAYGLFVVAYTALLLVTAIQTSLVGYPLLVIGTRYEKDELKNYISNTFYIQLGYTAIACGVVLILILSLSGIWGKVDMKELLVFLLFGTIYLGQQFFRRVLYLLDRVGMVLFVDTIFSALLFSGLFISLYRGILGLDISLWVMVIGGVFSYILGIFFSRDVLTLETKHFKKVCNENWHFGKWLIGQSLFSWGSGQIYYILSAVFLDLRAPAILKVCANLLAPLHVLFQGLDNILTVAFSRRLKDSINAAKKFMIKMGVVIVLSTACYSVLIALFFEEILRLLYGNVYSGLDYIILIFALAYLFRGIARVPEIGLISMHATKDMFFIYLTSMIITLLSFYPLLKYGSITGAAVGTVFLPYLTWAILSVWRVKGAFNRYVVMSEVKAVT